MKQMWTKTTGWKEDDYRMISPGSVKAGTLLYGSRLTGASTASER